MVFKFPHFTASRAPKRALNYKFTLTTVTTRRSFLHETFCKFTEIKHEINRVQFIPSNKK